MKDIDGNTGPLSEKVGNAKAVLVVNVASAWGLTDGHYKQLAAMYKDYKVRGLEIFGFPCN